MGVGVCTAVLHGVGVCSELGQALVGGQGWALAHLGAGLPVPHLCSSPRLGCCVSAEAGGTTGWLGGQQAMSPLPCTSGQLWAETAEVDWHTLLTRSLHSQSPRNMLPPSPWGRPGGGEPAGPRPQPFSSDNRGPLLRPFRGPVAELCPQATTWTTGQARPPTIHESLPEA